MPESQKTIIIFIKEFTWRVGERALSRSTNNRIKLWRDRVKNQVSTYMKKGDGGKSIIPEKAAHIETRTRFLDPARDGVHVI